MRKMKINEIFYSLQGEGYWTGTPMVFVRFSGCNLRCSFCDTLHEAYEEMSENEIVEAVSQYPAERICLTGGEPSLQATASFVDRLHEEGYIVHMETNGSQPVPENIDWLTLSPKEGCVLEKCDELKLLFPCDPTEYLSIETSHRFLQPITTADPEESEANTLEAIDYVKANPWFRLSLQTHKYLNIP